MAQKQIEFERLQDADLIIDCIYCGGKKKNTGDDPLTKLLGCGNQGGFRRRGSSEKPDFVVLVSNLAEPDWPDYLDEELGHFIYYGDNRTPGSDLHSTGKQGNVVLRHAFDNLHTGNRSDVPPFLIFTKAGKGRDYEFRGLAVPGSGAINPSEDLVAIWKSAHGKRFQNYRAIFTILDVQRLSRGWLNDLKNGDRFSANCPPAWRNWAEKGKCAPLKAAKITSYRTPAEQLPGDEAGKKVIAAIASHFKGNPYAFEKCAAEMARLMDPNIISFDMTRPTRDGGRDAIGKYRIGLPSNYVAVEFALEAKLYSERNSVGVKETSRLISRLRFRQFGILVTTSFVAKQAYDELIDDRHPVILICARDIVEILGRAGIKSENDVIAWLNTNFPSQG